MHKGTPKTISLMNLETNSEPYLKRNNSHSQDVSSVHGNTLDCANLSSGNPHPDDLIDNIYWKQ